MKTFFLLCAFAVATVVAEDVELSSETIERALLYSLKCIREVDASPENVVDAMFGRVTNTEKMNDFWICFFKRAGYLTDSGELDVDAVVERLPANIDKVNAEAVLRECKMNAKDAGIDATYEILMCYVTTTNMSFDF